MISNDIEDDKECTEALNGFCNVMKTRKTKKGLTSR